MTHSEEESSLQALSTATDAASTESALRSIKHAIIGHDQNKELFVRLGLAERLMEILGRSGDNELVNARVEAGVLVGSLAYGGEAYILHLLSSNVLPRLTACLNPATEPPKLLLSSLRTLNTMLDTYVSPTASLNPESAITDALYTPQVLQYIRDILSQTSTDPIAQQQISLAASLIAKSVGRPHRTSDPCEVAQCHQKLLAQAGVLDALATRLASFYVGGRSRYSKPGDEVPPPAPPNAKIAPILGAIAAVIQGSKLRSIEFLFSPALMSLFPPKDEDEQDIREETPSKPIISPAAFPPLSATVERGGQFPSPSNTQFPTLGSVGSMLPSLHAFNLMHQQRHNAGLDPSLVLGSLDGSEGSATERADTDPADVEEDDRQRTMESMGRSSEMDDLGLEIEETDLIVRLIAQVRRGDAITRLSAASVLTNLFLVGLIGKPLIPVLALLIVPVLVRLLDEEDKADRKNVGFGSAGVGGVDIQTWNKWQVEETAPAVLSRLVVDDQDLQKAAVEAGAIKKLATVLKKCCAQATSATNGDSMHRSGIDESWPHNGPHYNHRMRVKNATLRCLANLALFKDDYRKLVIESGAVVTVVSSCLKPLTPIRSPLPPEPSTAEGNPPYVLVAACEVIRSVSRSVSILRTSLIDAGVAVPLFSLLRHPDIIVRIAATGPICNLVLEFSPMRRPIMEAGAIEELCNLAKDSNHALRLNALWALKHLVMDADSSTKRRSFEGLGADFILDILSSGSEDTEMPDHPLSLNTEDLTPRYVLPPKASNLRRRLLSLPATNAIDKTHQRTVLQEQTLSYLRNLIMGCDIVSMIDLIFSSPPLSSHTLLGLLTRFVSNPTTPPEIINESVYLLVHLANGSPGHRQAVVEHRDLLAALLELWDYRVSNVRTGMVWAIINLTWPEEGEDAKGVKERVNILKALGTIEKLREMRKDAELDVKERVKTAEFQMGVASSSQHAAGGR